MARLYFFLPLLKSKTRRLALKSCHFGANGSPEYYFATELSSLLRQARFVFPFAGRNPGCFSQTARLKWSSRWSSASVAFSSLFFYLQLWQPSSKRAERTESTLVVLNKFLSRVGWIETWKRTAIPDIFVLPISVFWKRPNGKRLGRCTVLCFQTGVVQFRQFAAILAALSNWNMLLCSLSRTR